MRTRVASHVSWNRPRDDGVVDVNVVAVAAPQSWMIVQVVGWITRKEVDGQVLLTKISEAFPSLACHTWWWRAALRALRSPRRRAASV